SRVRLTSCTSSEMVLIVIVIGALTCGEMSCQNWLGQGLAPRRYLATLRGRQPSGTLPGPGLSAPSPVSSGYMKASSSRYFFANSSGVIERDPPGCIAFY